MTEFEKALDEWRLEREENPTHLDCARWAREWCEKNITIDLRGNSFQSVNIIEDATAVDKLRLDNAKLRGALEKLVNSIETKYFTTSQLSYQQAKQVIKEPGGESL